MNIVLSGMPKSGKSVLGKGVAELLGYSFVDTDQMIEQSYSHNKEKEFSCRDIFLKEGESTFRCLERRQIELLSQNHSSVIALGGGSLCFPGNVSLVKRLGTVIYLKASLETLWSRFDKNYLPAYLNPANPRADLERLFSVRTPVFEAAADRIVEVDSRSEEELMSLVISVLSV